jgi:hypothetical protein
MQEVWWVMRGSMAAVLVLWRWSGLGMLVL